MAEFSPSLLGSFQAAGADRTLAGSSLNNTSDPANRVPQNRGAGRSPEKQNKSMFESISLDGMNETDVREVIVRPILQELGYKYGTSAHIRTEVPLRYSKVFLGRKNAKNDPDLRGRADYVCEVVSYGRWVVEVKSPAAGLSLDDAQQAHTYAAHPEIAALFYLITNGRDFRLYRTSHPDSPALSWSLNDTAQMLVTIKNVLGPDAIKKRAQLDYVDPKKPLGPGLNSSVKIVGGIITYSEYNSAHPLMTSQLSKLAGQRAGAVGRNVTRTPHNLIRAELELAGPYQLWDTFNRAVGIESYVFESASEFISDNQNEPTIFQNISTADIPKGMHFPGFAGLPSGNIPFGFEMLAYTEAVGYLEGSNFKGTFSVGYELKLDRDPILSTPRGRQVEALIANAKMMTHGEFALVLQP